LVAFEHFDISKTVKIMSETITELIWQAKIQPEYIHFEVPGSYNVKLLFLCKSISHIAISMASNRCQQSFFKVSVLCFEKQARIWSFSEKSTGTISVFLRARERARALTNFPFLLKILLSE
jgi:hypothetical protein